MRAAGLPEVLATGAVVLLDGAMGTELLRAGLCLDRELPDDWNLTRPAAVQQVHEAYLAAGARGLVTNTFNAARLRAHPRRRELFAEGIRLARTARGGERWVLASVGPLAAPGAAAEITPWVEACGWLDEADAILLETQTDLEAVTRLLEHPALRSRRLIVSFAYLQHADALAQAARAAGWAESHRQALLALGVNCGCVDRDMLVDIVARYRRTTSLPILARPNAGTPPAPGGPGRSPVTPETLAAWLPDLLQAGASLVGGCCGTTPEHIAALRPVVEAWNRRAGP